jgi:hypothetical protein
VIVVTSTLELWAGDSATWHFISIGAEESIEIRVHGFANPRGFGSVRVLASIGEVNWRTSVFPQKSGGYLLPVKADVRRRAGIVAGDEVTVGLNLV